MKFRSPFLIIVLLSSFFTPLTGVAIAATPSKPLNLITSPLPIDLATKPGTTVTTDIRVKQGGTDTEKLNISLMKFAAFGSSGKPRLADRGPNDDYFDWVKFSSNTITAPPNVWQTVKMTINVPKSAQFGYYYAVVFTRAGDDTRPDKGAAISGGTAVLVLLDALVPNAKRKLELTSFAVTHRLYEYLPAHFYTSFHNSGNVHQQPKGDIFIKRGSKTIGTIPLNGEGGNILPASNRIFQNDWLTGFPVFEPKLQDGKVVQKNGEPVRVLKWDFSKLSDLRIGKYSAVLEAVYDDGSRDQPIEASISFWVIPWKVLSVLLVLLILILAGFFFTGRGIWNRFRGRKQGQ
jgi:hypothetical protein